MLKKALFAYLLSVCSISYAQDSLSVQNSTNKTASPQTAENNIKHLTFKRVNYKAVSLPQEEQPEFLIPAYIDGEYLQSKWNSNWFINLSGGASAFIGNPLGCEDLFGRVRPMLHASIGKWFSSTVGGRVVFQGLDLKNHFIERQKYCHIHADFLWNATNQFRGYNPDARWNLIPFLGTGIVHNQQTHQHPFTLNYGLINSFKVHDRFSLSLELGGFTTLSDFDGAGKNNQFADHLFHVSAGISITLGEKGWKRVVDVQPYINQNNQLLATNRDLYETNRRLRQENTKHGMAIDQMRNILEIEGLLKRYYEELNKIDTALPSDSISTEKTNFHFPKNDYSGLNSLRERLSATYSKKRNGDFHNLEDDFSMQEIDYLLPISGDSLINGDSLLSKKQSIYSQYISRMIKQKECIGSPVLFFFKIRTASLTEPSQLANLDEIVRLCKKYDLRLRVTGYADSATGNEAENTALSQSRAQYVTSELQKRGIVSNAIIQEGKGGVDIYSPNEINRCVKVEIHLP
ncbi:OmpA family protein [Bacteroides sp.]|jgi:hypothetical protein|uniref:OmpA family protein n=1 Tax=Bacteroides sp. TaxID=29523 RepID=UPI00260D6235|nr:OmpA family protein [Bacteroides sp.]MDD3038058.1 OmpA family protein [Bacteroides sp.]